MVQLSHLYMITGKTIALTRWTFFGKVMPLLFNKLSRFVIAFLPRSKHLLILWLQWSSIVILEPKKIRSVTVSTVFPSIYHEVIGYDAMNWRTIIQRSSHIVAKVIGSTTDFPTWGSGKRTKNFQRNRFLVGIKKTLCIPGPRRKEQWPHKRQSDLPASVQ